MPVIVYRDTNYQGPLARLQPGFHSGQYDLEGYVRGSNSGESLDNAISSVRVDPGYVAVLYGGVSPSASGGGARTLIGPTEISDLAAVGMADRTSSIQVLTFSAYTSSAPRDFGVSIYSQAYRAGPSSELGQGDFDRARLDSAEVGYGSQLIRSICVGPQTLAVLYTGTSFDSTTDSVVVVGPTCVEDLDQVGMMDVVNSIRVMYTGDGPTIAGSGGTRDYHGGTGFGSSSTRHQRPMIAGMPIGYVAANRLQSEYPGAPTAITTPPATFPSGSTNSADMVADVRQAIYDAQNTMANKMRSFRSGIIVIVLILMAMLLSAGGRTRHKDHRDRREYRRTTAV